MTSTRRSSNGSGKNLRGQATQIIYDVSQYFKMLKEKHNIHNANVINITSDDTRVPVSTVKRILQEGKESCAKGQLTFSTPWGKHYQEKNTGRVL